MVCLVLQAWFWLAVPLQCVAVVDIFSTLTWAGRLGLGTAWISEMYKSQNNIQKAINSLA